MTSINARFPMTAASQLATVLKDWCRQHGYNPDAVYVWKPDDPRSETVPTVCWEEGPFEWAPYLLGGNGIASGEGYGIVAEPEATFDPPRGMWEAQVVNNFTVAFFH